MRDRKIPNGIRQLKIGSKQSVTYLPMDQAEKDNPNLSRIRLIDDTDDFDLKRFMVVEAEGK